MPGCGPWSSSVFLTQRVSHLFEELVPGQAAGGIVLVPQVSGQRHMEAFGQQLQEGGGGGGQLARRVGWAPLFPPCSDLGFTPTCLEVDRVHAEVVGMQVAKLGEGAADVVQMLQGAVQRLAYFLSLVDDVLRAGTQVKVGEVGLALREDYKQPVAGKRKRKGSVRTPRWQGNGGQRAAVAGKESCARPPAYLFSASAPMSSRRQPSLPTEA